MTFSSTVYFGIWGTAVLAWLALTYQYYGKWTSRRRELASQIRSYNARKSYGQSIGREALASNFQNPLKNDDLRQFAEENGLTLSEYTGELRNEIGRGDRIFWTLLFHVLGLAFTLAGVSFLAPTISFPFNIYLVVVYGWLGVSLALYLYL